MRRRHYTVRRHSTRRHPGVVEWAIVLDGDAEPLSLAHDCPEALEMASRLAQADWTVRGTPTAVLLADEEGGLSMFAAFGEHEPTAPRPP